MNEQPRVETVADFKLRIATIGRVKLRVVLRDFLTPASGSAGLNVAEA